MIRVVIDTNVVVSASVILSLAIDRRIQMFVSAAVLAEYEEVLHRPRLKFDPKRSNPPVTSKESKGTNR